LREFYVIDVDGSVCKMIEEFQVKAAKYIMEWGEWIEMNELLVLLNIGKDKVKMYMDRLLSLQNSDGGFPYQWVKGYPSGIIETARVVELASKIDLENNNSIVKSAVEFLIKKQLDNGSWVEEALDYEENPNEISTSAYVLKALATAGVRGDTINKGVKYLIECQRDDGLWPKSKTDTNPDLKTSGMVLMALHEAKTRLAAKAIKSGFESLMEVFMEKSTKEWNALSENLIPIIEAILTIKPRNGEAARKIIDSYIKSEKWTFQDRRSEDTSTLLNLLKIMALANIMNKDKVREEIEKTLELKFKLAETIRKFENEAREMMISRFESIGIRRNSPQKKILLGLFIYALLEQFFWAVKYEPQTEFIEIIDRVGMLDSIENYTNLENVKRALFKSRALSEVTKKKKEEAARSITLFAKFLMQNAEFNRFEDFTKNLMKFTLFEIAPTLSGATTAKKLGLLLRNYARNEVEMNKLFESLKMALECFPLVGSKISTLYPYYTIWVYDIWSEARRYVETPIDWNAVKTYINIGLSNLTLKDVRKDPKRVTQAINKLSEELFPEDKAKISLLWIAGREWCTKPYRCYGYMGRKCWFYDICMRRMKNEERREENLG